MTIVVKNGFRKKLFVDETGKQLAVLQSTKPFSHEKAVVGPDKAVKYETFVEDLPGKPAGENRRYTLRQGDRLVAAAMPVYAAGADHSAIPNPPRPVGMEIQMQGGTQWHAERAAKNAVEIWTPDGRGKLPDVFSICPQKFELPAGSDVFLWTGVYAMIDYMMHEDDTYPV